MKNTNSEKVQDIVVFRPKGAKMTVEVQLQNETVWLSQKQMAELFDKDVNTISFEFFFQFLIINRSTN